MVTNSLGIFGIIGMGESAKGRIGETLNGVMECWSNGVTCSRNHNSLITTHQSRVGSLRCLTSQNDIVKGVKL
jgi:hypothetical protein